MGVILILSSMGSRPVHNPALQPYIDFLGKTKVSAKDYVLSLFENHDLVILCERDHRDITQYRLILDIIQDPRFINTVGNVFTEVGVSTLRPGISEFLHAEGLPDDSVQQKVLELHRNASFYPLWEKQGFSYLLRSLYELNQRLPKDDKVDLYPSDMPFDWNTMGETRLREFWDTLPLRDSIMASQIIDNFERIRGSDTKRKKALVIMNYRHAFGHRFEHPVGKKPDNVGRFLFDKYGDKAANVYINFVAFASVRSDNDITLAPIQDGKWDAAFKVTGIENAGFNFEGSPFGEDSFDIWPFKSPFKYQDVFTGFVFYLPLAKFRCAVGVPGIIDSTFAPEILRRQSLYSKISGQVSASDSSIRELKDYYNKARGFPLEDLDSLTAQIDKWLK
ncbi:MAG: hypothetical protein WCE90_09315 [Candidatus Zixiibacteriota bacterium]